MIQLVQAGAVTLTTDGFHALNSQPGQKLGSSVSDDPAAVSS